MLTIYGLDLSFPSNKVRFTANYLGLEYEYKNVNLAEGEGQKDWYKAIHPAGKIPAIDDNGFKLFESNAIVKYLAQQANSPIYPKETQQQALVDQWIDFSTQHVGNAVAKIFFNRVLAPAFNMPIDEQSIKDGDTFIKRFLPIVDAKLGQTKNIAGDDFSLADIVLLATTDPTEVGAAKVDMSPYANLNKWRENLKQQEWYTKCFKNFEEAFAAMKG